MKKIYKILVAIVVIEFLILSELKKINISFDNWFVNAIGTGLFIAPILVLCFLLSKDEDISPKTSIFFKFIFGFLIISYIAGGIVTWTTGNQ